MMVRKRLGELLMEAGLITEEQLEQALRKQRETGQRLGEILINHGVISEQQLIEVIEFQLGIPHVDLDRYRIEPEVLAVIPEEVARRYRVLPIRVQDNRLTMAMLDPFDFYTIDHLAMITGMEIDPVISTREGMERALDRYYGLQESVSEVLRQVQPEEIDVKEVSAEDAPVVKLVNQIIEQAAEQRTSDIHFDPQKHDLAVRFRIDGMLQTKMRLPKHLQPILTARLKIMANLNIAERRLPQDGRIQMPVRGRVIDIRVAILPTIFGEKVVLRLLDPKQAVSRIEDLGFSERNRQAFIRMIESANGIVLVTGPTGSGKSTTLYAALQRLNTEDVNIITVEDPVEYQLDGINQVQVNTAIGLTYAVGLRSILREDPDIIMVGEIRDEETAEIAIRSALTGHLVLSTLHTNDAPSSIDRLLDMGIPSYLLASTLRGVVAQRLVRRICTDCREAYEPHPDEAELLARHGLPAGQLWRGRGCALCNQTGYRGRLAVHEVLPIHRELRRYILERVPAEAYRAWGMEHGYESMLVDGLKKALDGTTTVMEVLKVVLTED